jgi:hypothetical protein
MTEAEIIKKWIEFGWDDAEDYHKEIADDRIVIEELNPDNIHPRIFWSAADYHFKTDPVANSYKSMRLMSIEESNKNNFLIAKCTGLISQLEYAIDLLKSNKQPINIAEIGCGYGSLYKNYIIPNKLNYTGFDVIKRFDGAVEIQGDDGTFSQSQMYKHKNEFNIFYSSNTFQHLSPKQIKNYLHQVYDMLPYGGVFNLMYVHDVPHTYHYGQQVEIIEENMFLDLIKSIGFNIVFHSKMFVGHIKPMTVLLEK